MCLIVNALCSFSHHESSCCFSDKTYLVFILRSVVLPLRVCNFFEFQSAREHSFRCCIYSSCACDVVAHRFIMLTMLTVTLQANGMDILCAVDKILIIYIDSLSELSFMISVVSDFQPWWLYLLSLKWLTYSQNNMTEVMDVVNKCSCWETGF